VKSDVAKKTSCAEFYRVELVRQRDFHRGGWFWSRMFALFAGLFLTAWEPLRGSNAAPRVISLLVVLSLAIVAAWGSYRHSRKLQRKIDTIDAIKQAS
jgi:hypothetical protein